MEKQIIFESCNLVCVGKDFLKLLNNKDIFDIKIENDEFLESDSPNEISLIDDKDRDVTITLTQKKKSEELTRQLNNIKKAIVPDLEKMVYPGLDRFNFNIFLYHGNMDKDKKFNAEKIYFLVDAQISKINLNKVQFVAHNILANEKVDEWGELILKERNEEKWFRKL